MSTVELRCPRCGSPCSSRGDMTSEYVCSHCGATFHFIDPSKSEVIQHIRTHHCPKCGRPVTGEGYRCMECGKEDFCDKCVKEVDARFVCNECLNTKGFIVGPLYTCSKCNRQLTYVSQYNKWYCNNCKMYVTHLCEKCGKPANYQSKYSKWFCDSCQMYLRRLCPNCKGELVYNLLKKGWHCEKCQMSF